MLKYKMRNHESASCHIEIDYSNGVSLISYNTKVCTIVTGNNAVYITCSGNYSRTTCRHIAYFTSEFLGENYYYLIRESLLSAKKHKQNFAVVTIDRKKEYFLARLTFYLEHGKCFTGYYHKSHSCFFQ